MWSATPSIEALIQFANVWFDRTYATELWKEARPLGNTGRIITQLTPHRR